MRAPALVDRPVLANTAALIALRGVNLAGRLALLFVIARQVSPASFGLLIVALSVAEIGKVVADFGMDTLAIRELARLREAAARSRFARSLAGAKLLFGAGVYALLAVGFALVSSPEQAALGWIVGLTVLTGTAANFALDVFQARLNVRRALLPAALAQAALTAVALALLPRVEDLREQAAFFPAIEAAMALVLLAQLRRDTELGRPAPRFADVPALVASSAPIALTALLIMAYSRVDVLVLASRLDPAAVGWYGMAFRMTEPFQIAAAAFGLSVFSRLSATADGPERPESRYVLATLVYGAVSAVAVGTLGAVLLERFLSGYAPAVPILRVLAGALIFRTLNATLAGMLQAEGRFRLLTAIAAWNLVFVLALLVLFVSRYGAVGAALALLVGEGVNSLVQATCVARGRFQRRRILAGAE